MRCSDKSSSAHSLNGPKSQSPIGILNPILGLHKARLFYLPEAFMRISLKLLKKEEVLEKITGSFQLDISVEKEKLGWSPPISVEEGLKKTGMSF